MPRLSTHNVHAALSRAAEHLLLAGGADHIVSRADLERALSHLEGEEKALVDTLYEWLDDDGALRHRVTANSVQRAMDSARAQIIDRYDLNHDGLSEDEIARMPELGRRAVAAARVWRGSTR